jgi:predicted GNAT family acetyltransferase
MVLRREPDRPAAVEVEEVDLEEVRRVKDEIILAQEWGTEEVAAQLHGRDRKVGEVCRDRWFAARHEGEIAAACRLMQFQGIGKVEDVSTLEAARNRGLARAVVLEASKQSVADGDDFTFIVALSDDWPRQLYARLGFDPVGEAVSLQRKPDWVQAK